MGSGWHEWPLVLFTVLGQCVAGALIVSGYGPQVIWLIRRRCKMGSGWHEWPLMIFTVFGQCVVGGFIVLALALMKGGLRPESQQRVITCMFGLWVLMGIGFIASMLHLGSPMRAFNSLNRVGSSALSNEIASGSLFFAGVE